MHGCKAVEGKAAKGGRARGDKVRYVSLVETPDIASKSALELA